MITRKQARKQLKSKGWSYRTAAPVLGVSFTHLALVLTGKRKSRSLLSRIGEITPRPEAQKSH